MNSDFWKRLSDACSEMSNPKKSEKANVGKFSYSFENLSDVMAIVRPALQRHGLQIMQGKDALRDDDGSALPDYCVLNTYVVDTQNEAGDYSARYTADVTVYKQPADPQDRGKVESYARRYAIKTIFGLVGVDDDDDCVSVTHKSASKAVQAPSKATKQAETHKQAPKQRFARVAALKADAIAAGWDEETLRDGIAIYVGRPMAADFTDDEIFLAEQYLAGAIENRVEE